MNTNLKNRLPAVLRSLAKTGTVLLPLLLLAVFLGGWWIGRPATTTATAATKQDDGTVWTCSMHPTVRQPGPGLCPICEMDLIQVAAGGAGGLRDLTLTPDAVARLDVRVSPVLRQPASNHLTFLGRVAPDERKLTTTTARMDGRLDRLFVDYTGISVRTGDHLAEIYSPDLFIAQQELIQAKRHLNAGDDRTRQALYRASREKLRLLGLPLRQIDAIEQQQEPSDHITLNAPQDGIVLKLHKREGDYIKTGEALYTLADLSSVWIFLEAYEGDLPWIRFAQDVEFRADALPGRVFQGRIAFIDPVLDDTRRIARVRVNVPNPDRALKPGMFVRAEVHSIMAGDRVLNPALAGKWISPMHPEIMKDAPGVCDICGMDLVPAEELGFTTSGETGAAPLLVPSSAVLRTGNRAVVYRRIATDGDITFEGREIVLGPRAGDYFVVESGLREGDSVVTRGAFKLDSELQIMARPAMMLDGQSIRETSGLVAPPEISGAWQPVLRSLARARRDRDATDQFLGHLARARQIVAGTQPEFLTDDYAPLWREASMKLENLLAEAHQTARTGSSSIAWEMLIRELPASAAMAGLDWQLPELMSLPAPQLAELKGIIDAYLEVSDLLAHDKPAEALSKAPHLAMVLQESTFPDVPQTASAISASTDEASLRQALKAVTDILRPVIREAGNDQLGNLYLVHCPMAFGNTGADWFSRIPEVENPYYGSKMFSCGTVMETLSLPTDTAEQPAEKPGTDPHAGHNH